MKTYRELNEVKIIKEVSNPEEKAFEMMVKSVEKIKKIADKDLKAVESFLKKNKLDTSEIKPEYGSLFQDVFSEFE